MTDGSNTPAGWYPAAHAGGEQRYWDGNQWLDGTLEQTANPQTPIPANVAQPTTAPAGAGSTTPAPEPAPTSTATKKALNVVGLISLIVAGVGFIFVCIPGALIVGWVLLPIGFVLALVSLFIKGRGKGLGIAGLIVSIVGTIVGVIVFVTVVSVAFDDAFDSGGDAVVTEPSSGAQDDSSEGPATTAEGTRDNPYPIGSVIENDEWRVVVNSVTLAATDTVLAANSFNEPPATGNEYIIVNYTATFLGADAEGAVPAWVIVEYVTADGTTVTSYDNFVMPPDPAFDSNSTLYTDGAATGNIVFDVPSASAGAGALAIQPGMLSDKVFVAVQ